MRFIIVTGISGAGKTTALKVFEDMGFFCVDNLPISLITKFAELSLSTDTNLTKVALGVDIRSKEGFGEIYPVLDGLKEMGINCEIMFFDANNEVLVKRFKETRRRHPLADDGMVDEGLLLERNILEPIRKRAAFILDTSFLLPRELKREIENIFIKDKKYNNLNISVFSFGFKYGIPSEADIVFDVRFLPNPFYIKELKEKTGTDEEVRDYVMSFEETKIFLDKMTDMLEFLIPNYVKEGKNQLVVAIGCTGGKHRSVTIANEIFNMMNQNNRYGIKVFHRDIKK